MNSCLLAAQCALIAVKFWRQRVNDISAAAAQFQTVLNCLLVFMAIHGTNSVSLTASYMQLCVIYQ